MLMSCDIGLHKLTKQVLNNRPWFGYKEGDKIIEILDSPKKKINKDNSKGVADTVASALNKVINDGYKNIGQVYYPGFLDGRGIVHIAPTNKQLDLINASNNQEIAKLQKQVDFENQKKAFLTKQKEGNWDMDEEGNVIPFQSQEEETENMYEEYSEVANRMKLIEKYCR